MHLQSPNVTMRCPTGAISWVEGQQFRDMVLMKQKSG
jgi:hypothetical protein